jgi:hypothetical protein
MLRFILHRQRLAGSPACLGRLSLDGHLLCDTLEPPSHGLTSATVPKTIRDIKRLGRSAIPTGVYRLVLGYSPRFSPRPFYKSCGGGLVPRLLNVSGFEGVLIHCGNTVVDTCGCILVGRRADSSTLVQSQKTYGLLMRQYWMPAAKRGEPMYLEIIE